MDRLRSIRTPEGLDFRSNDYLALSRDPRLVEAAVRAAERYGAGCGAARLLGGTTPLHDELEDALARWKGTEACLLLNTGFQANATLIPALLQRGDAVFSDSLNHASIVDGCRMAKVRGVHVHLFRHRNLEDLDAKLQRWREESRSPSLTMVVTDSLFSMDGDEADLPGLVALCEQHQALLMVDEAHATGLLGPTGAGLVEYQNMQGKVPLVMGTLGKALGSFGAFVACSRELREHFVNTCRGFIFSTALPPASVGAALEAVRIAREEPWRRERALSHAQCIREALGISSHPSAIVPVVVGAEAEAVRWAHCLQEKGFDVRAVRPPAVPEGTSRLRITTGAHLEASHVEALIDALESLS
jgi:8-amino-7-oxononanoate synthase